jgi:hypothetical protein
LGSGEGRGIRTADKIPAHRQEPTDIDNDDRKTEHRYQHDGDDHENGATLIVQTWPQPSHRKTPLIVCVKLIAGTNGRTMSNFCGQLTVIAAPLLAPVQGVPETAGWFTILDP